MTTRPYDPDAFAAIDGVTLERYADVCRALVRQPGGTLRHLELTLRDFDLTVDAWERIRAAWTERIAGDPFVRGAFRRLYVGDPRRSAGIE